jgi:predicted ArsR family transcriptional regulator
MLLRFDSTAKLLYTWGGFPSLINVDIAMASSLEGSRLKILAIIRERGAVTIARLAQEIGLASPTIRRHLDILLRDHLVTFQQVHKKLGRPEFVYSLTEEGHESGHRDYQKLLTLLLSQIKDLSHEELANKAGEELIRLLIARISDQISSPYTESRPLSPEARVAKLEQALTDGGFSPQLTRENGTVSIRLCNCPFRAAALCEGSVCHFDQRLIANILGVEPVRESTIRDGGNTCSYAAVLDH